jgi:hypothetical protein
VGSNQWDSDERNLGVEAFAAAPTFKWVPTPAGESLYSNVYSRGGSHHGEFLQANGGIKNQWIIKSHYKRYAVSILSVGDSHSEGVLKASF